MHGNTAATNEHLTKIRAVIDAEKLLELLQNNALGEHKPPLSQNQIRSAEICLAKALPNLSHQTLEANVRELPPRLSIVRPDADAA